jgi:membrane protein insertase Oxa1/YidC/SpoIIIJ
MLLPAKGRCLEKVDRFLSPYLVVVINCNQVSMLVRRRKEGEKQQATTSTTTYFMCLDTLFFFFLVVVASFSSLFVTL